MTIPELKSKLDTLDLPVAYRFFRTAQEPPFICFYVDGTDNEFADNSVYTRVNQFTVELYTETKNPVLEANLEAILPPWNKVESYIDDEQLFLVAYSFEDIQ